MWRGSATTALLIGGTGIPDSAALRKMGQEVGDQANPAKPVTLSADRRGRVSSLILKRGNVYSFCMRGRNGGGFAELLDPLRTMSPEQVRAVTGGGHGNNDAGFDYLMGQAGSGVTQVILTTGDTTVDAYLEHGFWTAWWPDPHLTPPTANRTTITVTLADGRTRTEPLRFE